MHALYFNPSIRVKLRKIQPRLIACSDSLCVHDTAQHRSQPQRQAEFIPEHLRTVEHTVLLRSTRSYPKTTSTAGLGDPFSVEGGYAKAKHLTSELSYIEAERTTDGRVTHIDQLSVQPDVSCVPGIIITANDEFFGASIIAENIRRSPIEFESFRPDHARRLNVEASVSNRAY